MKNRNLKHSDNWKTPEYIYKPLNKFYKFDFDPCPLNHDISLWDGLKKSWGKVNFCNPPYSRKLKDAFVKKGILEFKKGKKVIFLLPVSTSTFLFHDTIMINNPLIIFIKQRIKFEGYDTFGEFTKSKAGMHDSMLIIFDKERNNSEIQTWHPKNDFVIS